MLMRGLHHCTGYNGEDQGIVSRSWLSDQTTLGERSRLILEPEPLVDLVLCWRILAGTACAVAPRCLFSHSRLGAKTHGAR